MKKSFILGMLCYLVQISLYAQTTHEITVNINQPVDCSVVAGVQFAEAFSVFPNPASRSFSLESNVLIDAEVTLVDLQGREVFKESLKGTKMSVDVRAFRKGVYVLRILYEGQTSKTKISIQ